MKAEVFNYLENSKLVPNSEHKQEINNFKDYFKSFFKKYPSMNYSNLCNVTPDEILIPLIILKDPYHTSKIIELTKKYNDLFNKDMDVYLAFCLILYFNLDEFKILINKLMKSNVITFLALVKPIMEICHDINIPPIALRYCNDYLVEHQDSLNELSFLFSNIKPETVGIFTKVFDATNSLSNGLVDNEDINNSLKKEIFKYLPKNKNPFSNTFNEFFNYIHSEYTNVLNKYANEDKEINRHNKKISQIIEKLNVKGEIKNIDDIIKLCPDKKAVILVIDYINEHNTKIYHETLKELENLKRNSNENLEKLFNKYHSSFLSRTINEQLGIKNLSYEEIENILLRLNKLNLNINEINITNINITKLSIIEDLINKGVLTIEFINNNINLFYQDNDLLNTVVNNISILSNENINIINYHNCLSILTSYNIQDNLNLLKEYNLTINRNTLDISFLSYQDLSNKIDFLISIDYNLTTLDILNKSIEDLFKLKIANILNIPLEYIQDNDLLQDLSNDLIPEDIKVLLQKKSQDNKDLPIELLPFMINNQVLSINGTLVSVNKLKRNLSKLEFSNPQNIFYAIIYQSYYSIEEIINLQAILLPKEELYTISKTR